MSTAVVLAGGESRRMKKDKMTLRFGAESFLESAVNRFSKYFDTVVVSVADPDKYPEIRAPHIVDIYKGCGPLSGLHAALTTTDDEGVFLVAADLPYADPSAAKRIVELAGASDICIMVDSKARYEPLFGYYKKTILPQIENNLRAGNYKIAELFNQSTIRLVTISELGSLWHDKLLLNVNYPDDYEKLTQENI